jgi:hypothetical protein
LDPANFGYRYGSIPFQFSGTSGLFIRKVSVGEVSSGVTAIKKIESSTFANNFDNLFGDITFSPSLTDINIKIKREYNGDADNQVRAAYFYSKPEDREKLIKELLESTSKDMKINSSELKNYDLNTDDYLKPVILEADVTSGAFTESAGGNTLFLVGDIIGKQAEMYQEHKRQNPIEIYYCHNYHRVIKINIPEGYELKGLEKLKFNVIGKDGADEAMGFLSDFSLAGNVLTVTIDEYYKKINMPVTAIDEYKKVINASADFNKVKLVLVKN